MAFKKFLSILGASVLTASPVATIGCESIKSLSTLCKNGSSITIEWTDGTRYKNVVDYLVRNLGINEDAQISGGKLNDGSGRFSGNWRLDETYAAKEKNIYVINEIDNIVHEDDGDYNRSYFEVDEYSPDDNYVDINYTIYIHDDWA